MKRTLLGTAVVLLLAAGLSGCQKKSPTGLADKSFVGTWIEDTSSVQSAGVSGLTVRKGEATERRELVINSDNTYKMTICKPDGKPLDPAQDTAGTWRVKNAEVFFDTSTKNLSDKFADDTPLGLVRLPGKGDASGKESLEIKTEGGKRIKFIRSDSK
jgi:hypothetical protein